VRISLPKKATAGAGIVAVTLATMISYGVQELIAALMIFSVAFAAFATAYLILALIQEAVLWGMSKLKGIVIRLVRVKDGRSPILPRTRSRV
jgi:hypothetical protein